MVVGAPPPDLMTDLSDSEKLYLARFGWYQAKDSGYSTQQATRPQTIGYALTDSPVGQMAWIVEKCHGWTDCGHQPGGQSIGGHPENALSREAMLDAVSLYWLTASAASSARLYWHSFRNFFGGRNSRADRMQPVSERDHAPVASLGRAALQEYRLLERT